MILKFLFAGLFLVLTFNQSAVAQRNENVAASIAFWTELQKLCGSARG